MKNLKQDQVLGVAMLALGMFVALYWAQIDSETGLVERVRGRDAIGDALAPTVAGVLLAIAGGWLTLVPGHLPGMTRYSPRFLASLIAFLITGLCLMRWGGPTLVEAMTGADYRPLRDTAPWKYVGFVVGGSVTIAALIWLVERKLHWSRLAVAIGVAVILALFYDLPFEDLLLPPNGDV